MNKNPTTKEISFYTALFISLIVGGSSWFFLKSLTRVLILSAVSLSVSYFLIFSAIDFFIYRKIKLIYKNIHSLKTMKLEPQRSPDKTAVDPLSEVEQQVMGWAEDRKTEIEQLKMAESYRKEFLSNVSHELKTPLFSIQGYISTLIESDLDDKELLLYFLKKASENTDRLTRLVEDLDAISKLESGMLSMEPETFDIRDLVMDVFDSLAFWGKEKNITFDFKEGCNHSYIVEADKERIRQVLVNLIVNSIKYGKENGLTLVGLYDMDENILVEVTDNGIGISSEHLSRLFERFYRVDKSRSRDEGGTGLGLSIVKHILEAHGQTIHVRSSVGVGTTFGFTLKKS